MYLFAHYTAADVIDLDDLTGNWAPILDDDDEPLMVGQMSMLQRADFSVRGSYTVEHEKRCFFYWTDDNELVFRTPDERRFGLFRRENDGKLIELIPGMSVDLQPALVHGCRALPTMSTFTLTGADGATLFAITYDSARYLQAYQSNVTFTPDEDLSDWDFFVAVKRAVDELTGIARLIPTEPIP